MCEFYVVNNIHIVDGYTLYKLSHLHAILFSQYNIFGLFPFWKIKNSKRKHINNKKIPINFDFSMYRLNNESFKTKVNTYTL